MNILEKLKATFRRFFQGKKSANPIDRMELYEHRLVVALEKIDVASYDYDWTQGRKDSDCWVGFRRNGKAYRSSNCSGGIQPERTNQVDQLFGAVVRTIESLAEISSEGVISLDQLLSSLESNSAVRSVVEECDLEGGETNG